MKPIEGVKNQGVDQLSQTYLEKEIQTISTQLDKEMKKGKAGNHEKILEQILKLVAYMSRVNNRHDEKTTQDLVMNLRQNIEAQKDTYGGKAAWGHAIFTFGVQAGATALAFTPLSIASSPMSYMGQATDKAKAVWDEGKQATRLAYTFVKEELQRLQQDLKDHHQRNGAREGDVRQSMQQMYNAIHDIFAKLLQS